MKNQILLGLATLGLTIGTSSQSNAAESPYLFGDWDGQRSALKEDGIEFTLHHIFDVYDDISGAPKSGHAYFGRQRIAANLDLEKLFNIKDSSIGISGVHQYGRNYNRSHFGVLTNPSSIEGTETTRLANIWFSQNLMDGDFNYKIGKVDAVGEFGLQEYGSSFMNDEFAYVPNAIFSTGLPYDPAEKLGAIVTYSPGENDLGLYLKGGVFDSNKLDAFNDDHNGLNFDWHGPVAYASEIGYRFNGDSGSKPGFVKLGTHYNTSEFTDFTNPAKKADDNYLVYVSAGQTIHNFDSDGTRHLDASLTWVHAPENRNLYNNEFTAVLRAIGPFEGRPTDELGLGIIAAFLSDDYTDPSGNSVNNEYTIEATYKAKVTPWLTLQPSLQAVLNPYGNNDRDTVLIMGLRNVITF